MKLSGRAGPRPAGPMPRRSTLGRTSVHRWPTDAPTAPELEFPRTAQGE